MPPRDKSYVTDILAAAKEAQSYLDTVDKAAFLSDSMRQSAVIRQLAIIGEAAKRLSEGFREQHTDIPWRKMIGMRNILIHAYDHVDLDQVFNAVRNDLPELMQALSRIQE
jgi:uncharacterized protein with HEPN domain